jgi:hypothetical protein
LLTCRYKHLNQEGFDHLLVLMAFVLIFAVFGTFILIEGHALSTGVELQLGSDKNLCMDNLGSKTMSGNTVDVYTCNSATSQKWSIDELSGRTDRFTLEDGQGTCADDWGDAVGSGPTHRVDVRTYHCNINDHAQLWEWEGSVLENVYSHGCINDPSNSTTPGTPLIVYSCTGSPKNELWYEAAQAKSSGQKTSSPNECANEGGNTSGNGCYFWAQGIQSNLTGTGAQVTMSANSPKVSSQDYHSDSEIYVATDNEKDSVEVCSIVLANSSTPHLQVDYWKNGAIYFNNFVAVNDAPIKNGGAMPTTGTFAIAVKYVGTQWQVYYNNKEVGYYPESVWGTNVFNEAQFVNVYGEVVGTATKETTSQMGNGLLGTNSGSSYFSRYSLIGTTTEPNLTVAGPSGAAAKVYNVGDITATSFHYGGSGF